MFVIEYIERFPTHMTTQIVHGVRETGYPTRRKASAAMRKEWNRVKKAYADGRGMLGLSDETIQSLCEPCYCMVRTGDEQLTIEWFIWEVN